MVRRVSAAIFTTLMVAGLVGVGVSPASAADPLTIVPPNPNGGTISDQIRLPDSKRGNPYSFQMQATGGVPPYTWEHDPATSSPWDFGLSISPTGLISGTPVVLPELHPWIAPGEDEEVHQFGYAESFRVTDSAEPPNTATISTRLWIQPNFRIATAALPNGVAGQPYAVKLSAKGGEPGITFSRGSALPKGMKLVSRTGVLFGTPRWGGQYSVTINAQDGQTHAPRFTSKTFVLSVAGPTGPGGGTGANPKPIIYGSGDLNCSGPVRLKAAAFGTQGSGYVNAQFKGKLTCQGSTGHPSVKVKTATVTGRYLHQGACSVLGVHSNTSSTFISDIGLTWKTSGGKMYATSARYSNHDARSDGWHLPATSPAGTSFVTGSYAGTGTSNAVIGTSAPATLQGLCSSGTPSKAKFTALFLIRL